MEPSKLSECSCVDGFTGDFCEFNVKQDHLLFVYHRNTDRTQSVFNRNGKLIAENAVIDGQVDVYGSCSTMLNGEAVIFGGYNSNRQVRLK